MGYLRNIIADARPRPTTRVTEPAEHMNDIPSVEGASPFGMKQRVSDRPVPKAVVSGANATPDSTVKRTLAWSPSTESAAHNRAQEDTAEKNQEIGGEEGAGASDHRRAVPPFGNFPETEQYVYSQSSRTASKAEEETETSAFPGGSRIHVTEIGDEAISSVVSQYSESTSNFLESVMTRHKISGATEESETRTSSSNGRGENGMFLRKQGENRPSGGFTASPPLFFSSKKDAASTVSFMKSHSRNIAGPGEQEDNVGRSVQSVKHPGETGQQTDISVNYLHKENDRAEPAAHREGSAERKNSPVSSVSSEVRREKRKEEITGLEKLRKQDQEEKRFVEQMDEERSVRQDIVLNKDIPGRLRVVTQDRVTKESPVFIVKPKKSRPEGPKVTIGSIEVIVEASAVPEKQSAPQSPASTLSSRHYLRRL